MDEELGTESQESVSQTVDTAKNTTNKVANATKKVGNAVAKAGKAVGKGAKAILSNPIVWKILLVLCIVLLIVVLIAGVVAAIVYALTACDFDAENGLLSSKYGISGDKFYGARFVYQDDETANIEIKEDYLTFTYNILNDTNSETGLTISLSADYTSDVSVIEITTNFANALIDNTDANLTLEQCITKIDHFGFTDNELTIVINSIANTLKNNSSGSSWASNNINQIKSALTSKTNSENYLYYKNVTPKIYVWDYILEDKDSTIKQLPKKDYIGFVFMPKENVTMTTASFMFVVEGGYGVDVCLYQNEGQNITPFDLPQNANVTWFKDKHIQDMYECDFNENLQPFTAIDTNNIDALSTPTSVFALLQTGTYSTYFNQTENYDGLTLIQNIADSKYIFLYMDNKDSARDPFNFAEFQVSYN